jgi:hypothetical protein
MRKGLIAAGVVALLAATPASAAAAASTRASDPFVCPVLTLPGQATDNSGQFAAIGDGTYTLSPGNAGSAVQRQRAEHRDERRRRRLADPQRPLVAWGHRLHRDLERQRLNARAEGPRQAQPTARFGEPLTFLPVHVASAAATR